MSLSIYSLGLQLRRQWVCIYIYMYAGFRVYVSAIKLPIPDNTFTKTDMLMNQGAIGTTPSP